MSKVMSIYHHTLLDITIVISYYWYKSINLTVTITYYIALVSNIIVIQYTHTVSV